MVEYITSIIAAAVIAGTPLLLGSLGELLTEKSGKINLGVEGMMFMGAIAGISASCIFAPLASSGAGAFVVVILTTLAAFIFAALGALLYCFLVVTLHAEENVVGLLLTIFGTGLANFLGDLLAKSFGGSLTAPDSIKMAFSPNLGIPWLKDIPIIGNVLFGYGWLTYLAILIAFSIYFILSKTRVGLNLRAVGENPGAAEAAGIKVTKYRYIAIIIGGGICGLGGMFISMSLQGASWNFGCVSGYGWLSVSLVIFAMWSSRKALIVSLLFGLLQIIRLYLNLPIPSQLYDMLPYLFTIIVLVIISIRGKNTSAQPEGCGKDYFRESR